jgi:transcriptional regulator with XRE-family HTH domain
MGTRSHHSPAYRKLCALLRQQREHAEMTIRELGTRLDKPYSFVSKVERGERRIDPIEFVAWCKACGADPKDAIGKIS